MNRRRSIAIEPTKTSSRNWQTSTKQKKSARRDLPKVPDDFHIEIFAQEPRVYKPAAACFDAQGRLLVGRGPQYPKNFENSPTDSVVLTIDSNQEMISRTRYDHGDDDWTKVRAFYETLVNDEERGLVIKPLARENDARPFLWAALAEHYSRRQAAVRGFVSLSKRFDKPCGRAD